MIAMSQTAIHQETIKLDPDARVTLYRLDMTPVGGQVLNFTSHENTGHVVRFAGVTFTALPVEFTGMTISGTGSLQTPTMSVPNTDGFVQAVLNTYGSIEHSIVSRWRTFARFLDDGETPDATAAYGPDVYVITRKTSDTPEKVEWELSASIDVQGVHVGRVMIRDSCMWRYRFWNNTTNQFDYSKAVCPYTGSKYFDKNNVEVFDPALDNPSRTKACCRLRFGENAPLPFGGFPGMIRGI